jgi:hypothetical protein
VYTSSSIDGQKYVRFTGKVYSDQGGSLEIQQADPAGDGTHTPGTFRTLTTVAVTGGTVAKFDEPLLCQYVRLKYTNGATNQTTFEISGYLAPNGV